MDLTIYILLGTTFVLFGIAVLLLVGLVIGAIYEHIIAIYNKNLQYYIFHSTAKVCDKEYEGEYTTTTRTMVGNVMVPHFHCYPEQFNIYLSYKGKEYCFDDEDLYNSVNVGDIVRVRVHKGYNKKGKLKNVYLYVKK